MRETRRRLDAYNTGKFGEVIESKPRQVTQLGRPDFCGMSYDVCTRPVVRVLNHPSPVIWADVYLCQECSDDLLDAVETGQTPKPKALLWLEDGEQV